MDEYYINAHKWSKYQENYINNTKNAIKILTCNIDLTISWRIKKQYFAPFVISWELLNITSILQNEQKIKKEYKKIWIALPNNLTCTKDLRLLLWIKEQNLTSFRNCSNRILRNCP